VRDCAFDKVVCVCDKVVCDKVVCVWQRLCVCVMKLGVTKLCARKLCVCVTKLCV